MIINQANFSHISLRGYNREKSIVVSVDGVIYGSILQASKELGVSHGCVQARIKNAKYPTWFKIEKEQ